MFLTFKRTFLILPFAVLLLAGLAIVLWPAPATSATFCAPPHPHSTPWAKGMGANCSAAQKDAEQQVHSIANAHCLSTFGPGGACGRIVVQTACVYEPAWQVWTVEVSLDYTCASFPGPF